MTEQGVSEQGAPDPSGSADGRSDANDASIGVRLIHADVRSTVERRCPAGHAQVLRCHPVRGKPGRLEPFPTLFWLVCPALIEAVSHREHEGQIKALEARLATDADLAAAVAADHRAYIRERDGLLSGPERDELEARGMAAGLAIRGVGGIRNWASIKCLHLHYAHHLARGTALGVLLDGMGLPPPCTEQGSQV